MSFNQEFTIHPVGQGLFYIGKFTHNSEVKFRMVFDCGSISAGAGQEDVMLYRDTDFLVKKVLDLLVISHFDQDHVNHIEKLLAEGIKVKKLIMPIITFSERLFLVARHLDVNNGFSPDDDFFIRFIIDPLGTINENLDGDSEVFLIESGPNVPIPLTKKASPDTTEPNDNNDVRFGFYFDNTEIFTDHSLTTNSELKIYKIKDSEKGNIASASQLKLMEFLFYSRKIGNNEEKFYDKVKELFFIKFSIDSSIDVVNQLGNVINEVKKIKSGPQIRGIFKAAKDVEGFERYKGIDILNLNTTALSLLHKNLDGIYYFLRFKTDTIKNHRDRFFYNLHECDVTHIQKYISSDSSRIETQNFFNRFPFPNYYYEEIN
jgi:hypothetical protein